MIDWDDYPNFSPKEFQCSCCGEVDMDADFMFALQAIRSDYGKPMTITSGYRCENHPVEAKKQTTTISPHRTGKAADIGCRGTDAYEILNLALAYGATGIGIAQKGDGRFLHIDTLDGEDRLRPWIWSY